MENLVYCAECKGRCCWNFPGIFMPGELPTDYLNHIGDKYVITVDIQLSTAMAQSMEVPVDVMKLLPDYWNKLIQYGYCTDTDDVAYIMCVRPKATTDITSLVGPKTLKGSYTCHCTLHDIKTGCTLSHEERPWMCKELVPMPDFKCGKVQTKAERSFLDIRLVEAWKDYQTELREKAAEYIDNISSLDPFDLYNLCQDDDSAILPVVEMLGLKNKLPWSEMIW